MKETVAPKTASITAPAPPSGRSAFRRVVTNPVGAGCIMFLLFVVAFAVTAPWLAPWPPNAVDLGGVNAPPFSPDHILGGDASGRDILSRLMWGSQQVLIGSLLVAIVSMAVGVTAGLVAGYYRGRFEAVADFSSDVIMSLPGVVLLIALYALVGPNIYIAMAVFGLIVSPSFFRLVRAVVVAVRSELYVDAAKVVGLSDARIMGRHILSAVRAPVIIQVSFILGAGIGIQAGIDFLGLGDPAQPSWGRVLQYAFNNIYLAPMGVLWPALLISLTVLAFVLLGNVLRDTLQSNSRVEGFTEKSRRKVVDEADRTNAQTKHAPPAVGEGVVLSIRGLRVGYPNSPDSVTEVVHGVDFDVRRGEIHGLVGESGSGKSQIAFATLGILPKEAVVLGGSIQIAGAEVLSDDDAGRTARGRLVTYIPQEPMTNLDPSFTIGRQLVYGLRSAKRMSKREAEARLLQLLTRVGIDDPKRVMHLYPHEISGGMAQRVLICGAVAPGPELIVADEPSTALDVTVQAEVLELLRELSRERGLAMLLVTHNLGVVADICDSVSVMKDGVIVERSDVRSLFSSPSQEYTKQLLASSRRVEIREHK